MSRPSELVDQTMEPIGIAMSNPEASYNNEIDNNGNDILTEPVDEAPFEDDVHSVLTGDNADNNNNNDNNETVQSTTSSMRDNIAQLQMQFSNMENRMSNQFSNINNQFSQMMTMLSSIAPPPVALTPTVVAPTPTVATQPTTVVVQPSTVVAQPSIRRGSIRALNFSNVNMTRRSTNSLPGNRPSNREVTTPAPRGNPQLPREPRRSIGSNILMSPPPQPRTEVPIPTDQVVPTTSVTVAPPEVISTQPTQSSPTQASGLQSVIEVNRSSINSKVHDCDSRGQVVFSSKFYSEDLKVDDVPELKLSINELAVDDTFVLKHIKSKLVQPQCVLKETLVAKSSTPTYVHKHQQSAPACQLFACPPAPSNLSPVAGPRCLSFHSHDSRHVSTQQDWN